MALPEPASRHLNLELGLEEPLLGIRGHLIDAPERGKLRSWNDGALVLDEGLIAEIGDYRELRARPRSRPVRWTHSQHVTVIPGLIDVHTHLPQYPAVARGRSELLPWLEQHIFPLEREFIGPKVRGEAAQFFAELARHGTTTAMVYTAVFEESCDAAFEAAQAAGLRVIMGKMMMDTGSYDDQLPVERIIDVSLAQSERLCKKWHRANDGLLDYAFSPRFALSCTRDLMCGAARLAGELDAYVQTHLAENQAELAAVQKQCWWADDYTGVYETCGLLGPRTMLGHCIHLSSRELAAIAATGAKIAHCPSANLFLSSGIMPLDRVLAAGIGLGLGSDVAAGPELNLWQVMRAGIESQKARSFYDPVVPVPTPAEMLYHATQGAAEALGKGAQIGSFEIGKEADLTVLEIGSLLPYWRDVKAQHDLSPEDLVALCIYRGGPHATIETLVRGRSVHRAAPRQPDLFG